MKIIIAPDKFKGSLTAVEAARSIARGVRRALPSAEVDIIPLADGGEGTVDALIAATGGQARSVYVTDPLGGRVVAGFGIFAGVDGVKTGVIEMAAASGLSLVGDDKRPLDASTFGTGELIKTVLDEGCARIIVGIGGSATTDGGSGMATALGARFINMDGEPVSPGGGGLARLEKIDLSGLDKRLLSTRIEVACDVDNPLFGPAGAAYIYAPQKGASPAEVAALDASLRRLAKAIEKDLRVDVADVPGAGAAGGLGAGLVAFAGAELRSGFELISDAVNLRERLFGADLLITGEGRMDGQTIRGKAPIGAAKCALALGVPAAAVVGSIGPGIEAVYEHGIERVEAIQTGQITNAQAMRDAAELIEAAAERLMQHRTYLARP